MSQHDMVIDNAVGASIRADLNLALPALASNSSGATTPSTTYAYQWWADTTSGWLKQRNAANSAWIHKTPLGTGAWVDVASATTVDLDANAANSDKLRITGTTATTGITLAEGQTRLLRAAAAWPITHGSSLLCPGSASYTCAAGDLVLAIGEATGVVRLMIWKADGTAVVSSGISAAAQSDMETGTSTALAVTPGRQQFHPSAAKAWINWNGTGTPAVRASYNMDPTTPITDNGTGDYTLNIGTDMSSASYAVALAVNSNVGSTAMNAGVLYGAVATDVAAGSVRIKCQQGTAATDLDWLNAVFFGDQA